MPLQDVLRLADGDVSEAAAFLAKTAAHVKAHGPLVKQGGIGDLLASAQGGLAKAVPNEIARNALIGGGIGGLGMGAVGMLQGRKKRQLLDSVLAGGLGGAGLGAGGTLLKQHATGPSNPIASREELIAGYKNKHWLDRMLAQAMGDPGAAASGSTFGKELAGGPDIYTSPWAQTSAQPGGGESGGMLNAVKNTASNAANVAQNVGDVGLTAGLGHPISAPLAAGAVGKRMYDVHGANKANAFMQGTDALLADPTKAHHFNANLNANPWKGRTLQSMQQEMLGAGAENFGKHNRILKDYQRIFGSSLRPEIEAAISAGKKLPTYKPMGFLKGKGGAGMLGVLTLAALLAAGKT